jgi:lipopolysaccharide/colanic/teichoic acid biosynthesis glycosyltransferase
LTEASVRACDIVGATILLVLLAPLFALVAAAIVIDSRGPVLYSCQRVGRHGRPFAMLKFRKMRHGVRWSPLTHAADDRFTRLGKLLVKWKFDELPQLWNVLKGDMSLVGPRPEDASFVELERDEFEKILTVPPGITGLSQLAFAKESMLLDPVDGHRYYVERLLPQKMAIDRMYAERRSLLLNARILIWTAIAVTGRADIAVHRTTGRLTFRKRPAAPAPALERLPQSQTAAESAQA